MLGEFEKASDACCCMTTITAVDLHTDCMIMGTQRQRLSWSAEDTPGPDGLHHGLA